VYSSVNFWNDSQTIYLFNGPNHNKLFERRKAILGVKIREVDDEDEEVWKWDMERVAGRDHFCALMKKN
jgi:hypothetical protein